MLTSKAENVRFSRLVMMILTLVYALFSVIESIYLASVLTLIAIIMGIDKSATTLLLMLFKKIGLFRFFRVDNRCRRSYQITRLMEIFEESMRLMMLLVIIAMHFYHYDVAATSLAFMMGMFMTISAFFGFCMSSVGYVIFQRFFGKQDGRK